MKESTMNLTRRDALSLGLLGTLALSSCKEKEKRVLPWEGGPQTEGELYGYIDRWGNWAIKPQFTWADDYSDGRYAGVQYMQYVPGRDETDIWRAMIYSSGSFVLRPTPWSQYIPLSENVIIRYDRGIPDSIDTPRPDDYARNDLTYGVIDDHGSWRSDDRYKNIDRSLGLYRGTYFAATKDGEGWGMADPEGGWLINPFYRMIDDDFSRYQVNYNSSCPLYLLEFSHSLPAGDMRTGLWGWLDEAGSWVLRPDYKWASCFNRYGIAPYADDSDLCGLISLEGKTVLKPSFTKLGPIYASELFIAQVEEGGPYGIVDASGSWVVEPAYKEIEPQPVAENPLIAFQGVDSELWGMAASPEEVGAHTTERFESVFLDARDSMFPAQDPESHLWGHIDSSGKWVIEPVYRNVRYFSPIGLAAVQQAV